MSFITNMQVDSVGPVGKVVETEEDLHIFGLIGAVHGAGQEPATCRGDHETGRAEATKPRQDTAFTPQERQPAYPPNRHNEFGRTRRDGGGWGMETGQDTSGAAGHKGRRSAAIPRAFNMNMDTVS